MFADTEHGTPHYSQMLPTDDLLDGSDMHSVAKLSSVICQFYQGI